MGDLIQRKNGWPAVVVDGAETEIFKGSLGLLGDWENGKRLARDGMTEMNDPDATNFALEWGSATPSPCCSRKPASRSTHAPALLPQRTCRSAWVFPTSRRRRKRPAHTGSRTSKTVSLTLSPPEILWLPKRATSARPSRRCLSILKTIETIVLRHPPEDMQSPCEAHRPVPSGSASTISRFQLWLPSATMPDYDCSIPRDGLLAPIIHLYKIIYTTSTIYP